MARILGIDPGSRVTGYGIIEASRQGVQYITSGCVRIVPDEFPERLKQIFREVSDVVRVYQPDVLAIEQVFMHKNADSALKLGQARGAAICAVVAQNLPVHEYAARQIKQALVGKGSAEKEQVQHMVKILLNIRGELALDASDALGVALCHSHTEQTQSRLLRLANQQGNNR